MQRNVAAGGSLERCKLGSLVILGCAATADAGEDPANCFFVRHLELPDLVNSIEGAEFELSVMGMALGIAVT